MRTKGVNRSDDQAKCVGTTTEQDLILNHARLFQGCVKGAEAYRQRTSANCFRFLGASKRQMNKCCLSAVQANRQPKWLTISQKLATFGEPEKIKKARDDSTLRTRRLQETDSATLRKQRE